MRNERVKSQGIYVAVVTARIGLTSPFTSALGY